MSYGNPFSQMATANKLSINDIQRGIQSGTIDAYIGIPLIQQKVKDAQKMQLVQAVLRQAEGGPPQTVSDSVLQAAGQVTRPEAPLSSTLPATDRQRPAPSMEAMPQGGGIEMAQSNLPTEYAGGGIVAFADKGAVELPGEFEDKNKLKAAGYTESLRDAPDRGRSYDRDARDLEAVTPRGIDRPAEGSGYEPYTPPSESFGTTLSRIGSGIKDFASSTLDPIGGESEGAMQRRIARESYYNTTTPPPSYGVTPFSPPAAQADPLAFLRKPGEGASSPAQGSYLDRLTAMPGATGAGPAGGAAPAAQGREGITLTPGVQPPKAPEYGEPTSFAGLEQALQDYTQGSRSRRQRLEDIILGQQADRPAMERENLGAAMRQAGAKMMAGRSPWALTNVGEGLMAGNEAYSAGVNQLRERDANIVKQLAALGLKGEELEQQAMRYGIDIQQVKADTRYKEAVSKEIMSRIPGHMLEPEFKQAQIQHLQGQTGLLGAEEQYKRTVTELLPVETAIKRLNALRKTAMDRPGSIPAKDIRELETVLLPSIMENPLAYGPLAVELQQFPDVVRGLQQDKDSPMFEKARMAAAPLIRRYIDRLKQEMYENAPSRRGTDYGYSSAED